MIDFIVQYWIEALCALLLSIITLLLRRQWRKLKEAKQTQQKNTEATLILLEKEIQETYQKYKGKDSIPLLEYEQLTKMCRKYRDLGGNGTAGARYEEFETILKHT